MQISIVSVCDKCGKNQREPQIVPDTYVQNPETLKALQESFRAGHRTPACPRRNCEGGRLYPESILA